MLRIWLKMGGKKESPYWFIILTFLSCSSFRRSLFLSHGVQRFILSTGFLIAFLSLSYRRHVTSSSADYTTFLFSFIVWILCSISRGSPPFSQEFVFTGLRAFLFLGLHYVPQDFLLHLLFLHVFTPLLIDHLAHIHASSNHTNTSRSSTCLSHSSSCEALWRSLPDIHLCFMSFGDVKFHTAKSELVLP